MQWWSDTETTHIFPDLPTVFAIDGERVSRDPISEVIRVEHNGSAYYIKRYHRAGKHLQNWIGMPRARTEWESLQYFKQLGLPTIELVAFGAEHRGIHYLRGALITKELRNSRDLEKIALDPDSHFPRRQWRLMVLQQIATGLATLHAERFCHGDLFWRNLLITESSQQPRVHFFDCPQGSRWRGPFLTYRRIKDLACFDKVGEKQLSRSDRLRCYLAYKGHQTLTAADKRELRRVLAFFNRKKKRKARKQKARGQGLSAS